MGYATVAVPDSLIQNLRHTESALDDFSILRSCRDSTRTIVRVLTPLRLAQLTAARSFGIE